MLMDGNMLDKDYFGWFDRLSYYAGRYVVVVEAKLQGEVLALVERPLSALELYVP